MFNSAILSLQIYATMLIAQATPQIDTTEEATLAFSGPQFFIALIAGLVLAFGFQMLLTNFSVAAGISVLDLSAKDRRSSSDSDDGDGLGGTIRTVETAAGVWTLATVTISLFAACLLAIKLSFLNSALMGATIGLVIWAAYFSVLVWMSSTAVGSIVGSVVGAATSGFQAIFGTATAALGAKAASSQVVSTAEATAAAIRKELTAYIDPADIKDSLNSYMGALKTPELNVQSIGQEFERLLNSSNLRDTLKSGTLPHIDRSTFETLVSDRTDLSRKDAKRIVDELEKSWHNITKTFQNNNPLQDLVDFFRSGQPQQLLSSNADDKLNQLLDKLIQQNQNQNQSPGWVDQAIAVLTSVVVGRTDLSELDLETVKGRFNDIKAHLQKQTSTITGQLSGTTEEPTGSALQADVDDYLLHTYPWKLTPAQIQVDFRAILTNPQASAREVRRDVEMLHQANFAQILQSRGLFTQAKIAEMTTALERVRQQVWQECYQAESAEMAQRLNRHLHSYLLSSDKAVLTSAGFAQGFKAVLEDPDADPQMLHEQLTQLDSDRMAMTLRERSDLDESEIYDIRQEAERLLREAIADTEGIQSGIQTRVDNQWQRLQDYLRNTGKEELNPEGIKRDLQTLLDDPEAGMHDLRWRLRRFDRDTLVQLLSQQRNLSEGDANRILDDVESSWTRAVSAPKTIAHSVQSQYDKTMNAVADYLRN
ncbi:MAG TPA: MFS transporter, partial [Stenomitos sp.]